MFPKFKIVFSDNTTFEGYSLKGDWNKLPDKPITSLTFSIGKMNLVLENYEEYNHLKEVVCIQGGKSQIKQYLIMGRRNDVTDIFIFDKSQKVHKETVEKGFEYYSGQINGWKVGLNEKEATYRYE